MNTRISWNFSNFPHYSDDWGEGFGFPQLPLELGFVMDDGDIRDTLPLPSSDYSYSRKGATEPQGENFWRQLISMLAAFFPQQTQQHKEKQADPNDPHGSRHSHKGSSSHPTSNTHTSSKSSSGTYAHSLREAAARTHPQFRSILRGDETREDAKIHDQESFARAVDLVAKEYGLDPNMFRAQLEKESGAFSQGYLKAMRHEGDLSRAGENNTSIGLGQISRKFLDGREWSDGGPNNSRVGGKTVTTAQYMKSPIIQLRIAAANLAMRIQDHGHGDLEKGLLYYVSGHTTRDAQNGDYLDSIDRLMHDEKMMNLGR